MHTTSLSSRGHISFTNNLADDSGGGLLSINSNVKLQGNISYMDKHAYYMGGVDSLLSTALSVWREMAGL